MSETGNQITWSPAEGYRPEYPDLVGVVDGVRMFVLYLESETDICDNPVWILRKLFPFGDGPANTTELSHGGDATTAVRELKEYAESVLVEFRDWVCSAIAPEVSENYAQCCPATTVAPDDHGVRDRGRYAYCLEDHGHDGDHYDSALDFAWDKDPSEYTGADLAVVAADERASADLANIPCESTPTRGGMRCSLTALSHSDDRHDGLPLLHYCARTGHVWGEDGMRRTRSFREFCHTAVTWAPLAVLVTVAAAVVISWF